MRRLDDHGDDPLALPDAFAEDESVDEDDPIALVDGDVHEEAAAAAAALDEDDAPAPEPLPDAPKWKAALAPSPRRTAGRFALAALVIGVIATALGLVPDVRAAATPAFTVAFASLAASAWLYGKHPNPDARGESVDDATFRRDVIVNVSALTLNLVHLLIGIVIALSLLATLGRLRFFGAVALGFVTWYPLVLFTLLAAVTGTLVLHARGPLLVAPRPTANRSTPLVGLGLFGALGVAALLAQAGLLGDEADRALFVLTAGVIALYYFVVQWARWPSFGDVMSWMEHEERLHDGHMLRNTGYAFLGLTGLALVGAIATRLGLLPEGMGLVSLGAAMLALVPATLTVGVKRFIAAIHAQSAAEVGEDRKRARVILNAFSVGLASAGFALGVITFLAFLAQAFGVALFSDLLTFFVAEYPILLSVILLPVAGAVIARTRVMSEEKYTDGRKAVTVVASVLAIVLAVLGIFLGSGVAEGTGFEIENGVIAMAVGVTSLIAFVHSRALLPSVTGMMKDAVRESEKASEDHNLKEDIRRRMVFTYVAGLVFIVSFVGFIAASTFGVVPGPGEGLATDSVFFLYLVVGLVLLAVIGVRYFQGVNIDPSWKKKEDDAEVGKKRLTASELQKYIVLGFSAIVATLLFIVGLLVQLGVLTNVGGVTIEGKYGTDFFVFAILLGLGPYGFYHNKEINRRHEIDTRFPDFLRDLAESQRAGMTLTEAVITASKGSYGVLTPEIRKMAAQIEWGVSFSDALQRFSKRVNTPLIERTVSLIVQASKAGGNVVDVLTAAADDAREIHMILKERKQSMSIYVMIIYIAFFVFMGVIGVLNAQFIPEVSKAVSEASKGGTVSIGGLTLKAFDEQAFKTLFFHGAVIQGFGGGLVAGVMEGGKPQSGLRHAFIMVSLAYVVFRFLLGA